MEKFFMKGKTHSRPMRRALKKLLKSKGYKRSSGSFPHQALNLIKKLSKVNDTDKKNVNELSPPKERHVKSIENRPLSPFSQIKHDVEQFRSTFSCKVDAFLSKTK